MAHKDILHRFLILFPEWDDSGFMDVWFPNGKNSIRVRNRYKEEFIFTYHAINDWKFETEGSFIKSVMGGVK